MKTESQIMLVLASSSPRRRELIRMLGLPVEVMPSVADESCDPCWKPERIVEELSLRKALAVRVEAGGGPERKIIVGSDTIVVLNGDVLGKPRDEAEARAMLSRLQGREHVVYTGLAVVDAEAAAALRDAERMGAFPRTDPEVQTVPTELGRFRAVSVSPGGQPAAMVGYIASRVTFRPMSRAEVEAYVNTGEPLDKAGAYGVQGIGAAFIEKIDGDFYSIMGLPLNLLYRLLLELGVRPFETVDI